MRRTFPEFRHAELSEWPDQKCFLCNQGYALFINPDLCRTKSRGCFDSISKRPVRVSTPDLPTPWPKL
jgi:hypothetical protein